MREAIDAGAWFRVISDFVELLNQCTRTNWPGARCQAAKLTAIHQIDEAAAILVQLNRLHADHVRLNKKMSATYSTLTKKIAEIGELAQQDGSQSTLAVKTRQLYEMSTSFNTQYLQLQSQLQNESRRYTTISNIMKTKHDTAKNSISNIR